MNSLVPMRFACAVLLFSVSGLACGSGTSEPREVPVGPTAPSGTSGSVTLTTPAPVSPINNEQLSTLRPTLTVQNSTSSASGTRTYEFQVSDRTDFTLGRTLTASFLVAVNQTGVTEGGDGRTSFVVPQDLQPATRMYWRSRVVQGSSTSSWSEPATFRTKLVGYSRPGELYDPLIHGETIGTVFGAHTWVAGKGIRLETQTSFVRYQLAEALANGEFSVEVEGLHPDGPDHKLKIFSMNDRDADPSFSNNYMSTMYRGINWNPQTASASRRSSTARRESLSPIAGSEMRASGCWIRRARISGRQPGAASSNCSSLMEASPATRFMKWPSRWAGRCAVPMRGSDPTRRLPVPMPEPSRGRRIRICLLVTGRVRRRSAMRWNSG